jgi:hypothetical protein
MDTIKKNTRILTHASKEVGLEIKVEKTKYMVLSRFQNAGKILIIRIANSLKMWHSSNISERQ